MVSPRARRGNKQLSSSVVSTVQHQGVRPSVPMVGEGTSRVWKAGVATCASPETSESRCVQEPTSAMSGQMQAMGCGRGLEMMLEMNWDHAIKHICSV